MKTASAVITGVGVVSPFGVGRARFWDALAAGESAIRPIRSFDAAAFPTQVAGEVPVERVTAAWLCEQAERVVGRVPAALAARAEGWERGGVLRDRKLGFAVLAALEAWQHAGCGEDERGAWLCPALGLERALLEDFSGLVSDNAGPGGEARATEAGGRGHIDWSREPQAALPAVRYRTPVDLAAALVRDCLALTGPMLVHTSACAAGALSLAHAASLIERGAASVVLCGAADSMINPLGFGGMCRLGAPSPRSAPDACRPFDVHRDGLAIGEGAALFVVEAYDRARARGARPLAQVLGWGSSQDAYKATAPRPDGSAAARAMEAALAHAELPAAQLGHINAHGTGTPLGDPAEVYAVQRALGAAAEDVPVCSIKGAVGHLMAASGAIELAASLLCFERDVLPGTAHHHERDPACALDIIGPTPRSLRVDTVLSNSFGFGGQNASVLLGRPD